MDLSTLYGVFVLLVLNVVFLGSILYLNRRAATINRWPSTMGMVFNSGMEKRKIEEDGHVHYVDCPIVHYSYEVKGQLYESTQVTIGPEVQEKGIESPIVRYPTGAQVMVFYNPRNPGEAVLERRAPLQGALWLIVGLMDFLICLALVWGKFQK